MRRVGLIFALGAALVFACGSPSADTPPEIEYGRDMCDNCEMIISEPTFASAYTAAGGTERKFDDIGGLLAFGTRTGELATADAWVHDYDTQEWVAAADASFVYAESIPTPMALGVVAFRERTRAEEFARSAHAEVLDWQGVVALADEGAFEVDLDAPEISADPGPDK